MSIIDITPGDSADAAFGEEPGPGLPDAARRVLTRLLATRFLTRSRRGDDPDWNTLVAYQDELRERLADLYFDLVLDPDNEVAFKRRIDSPDAPKSLLKQERPLARDASFLLLFLREERAHTDAQDGETIVTRTQMEEFLRPYRQPDDGHEARFADRVSAAAAQLVELKLLKQDKDADYLYTVSPAIVALIGIDEVARLNAAYQRGLDTASRSDDEAPEQPDEPEASQEEGA